ncbi:uncharacterized protein [Haliotis asinina]|uniref:uncharacterized protein isoform X2 n=1 Tax=Haliotis asinina TaxID=109174 RepID=UPI0035327AE4
MPSIAVFGLLCILGAVVSDDSGECSGDLVTGFSARQGATEGIHTELQTVRAECPITCGSSCCNTESCNIAVYDNATTEGTPNCRLLTCNPLEACIGFIEETYNTFVLLVTRNLPREKRAAPDAGDPQGFPQLSGKDPSGITPTTPAPGAGTSPAGSITTTVSSQSNNSSTIPVSSNNTATTTAGATSSKTDKNAPNGNVSQGEGQGVLIGGNGTINQSNSVPQANITQKVSSDATNTLQDKSKGVEIGGDGVMGSSVPSPPPVENATALNSTLSPSLSGKQDLATPPPPGGQVGGVPGDNVTSNATLSPPLAAMQDKDQGVPIADDSKLSGGSFPTPPPLGQSGSTTIRTPPPPFPATPPFPTSPKTPAATISSETTPFPTPPPLGNKNQTTFPTPPPLSTSTTSTTTTSGATTSSQTQSPTTTQGPSTSARATSQSTSTTTTTQTTITPPKRLTTVSTTKNPSSETTTMGPSTTSSTTTTTTQSSSPAATTLSVATEQTTIQSTTPMETPAQTASSTTQTTAAQTASSTTQTTPARTASSTTQTTANDVGSTTFSPTTNPQVSKETPDSNGGNGTLSQSASTSQTDSGHLMVVVLASALSIGLFIFLVVIIIVGKRVFESWQRRHYSRVDYLVNGMYN